MSLARKKTTFIDSLPFIQPNSPEVSLAINKCSVVTEAGERQLQVLTDRANCYFDKVAMTLNQELYRLVKCLKMSAFDKKQFIKLLSVLFLRTRLTYLLKRQQANV